MKAVTLAMLFGLLIGFAGPTYGANANSSSEFKGYGKQLLKADGTPRTMVIYLFEGLTAQDFIGIYSVLNFASGPDLKIKFVAKKKGLIQDERKRLKFMADYSIDEVKDADIFMVPGGRHFDVIKDQKVLSWVKSMYESSEYTVSVCTGSVILAAAGAITGKEAGTAWAARDFLAPYGVKYVPTPLPSKDGKYYSAAGASAGVEIGLMLLEEITRSKTLSEVAEFAAEWNPQMLYGSGDAWKAPTHVIQNFGKWMQTDPIFQPKIK